MENFVGPPKDILNIIQRFTALGIVFVIVFLVVNYLLKNRDIPNESEIPTPRIRLSLFYNIVRFWKSPWLSFNATVWASAMLFPTKGMFLTNAVYYTLLSPTKIKKLLRNSSLVNRPVGLLLRQWLGNGLYTSANDTWRRNRQMLTPAYQEELVGKHVSNKYQHTQYLIQDWRKHAHNQQPFHIERDLHAVTLNALWETATGSYSKEDDSSRIKSIQILTKILIQHMARPWIWPEWLINMLPICLKFPKTMNVVQSTIDKIISTRLNEMQRVSAKSDQLYHNCSSFLDSLLKAHLQDTNFTLNDVRDELNTFLFMGSVKSPTVLIWSLFLIGNSPKVQAKIVEELKSLGLCDTNAPISLQQLDKMHYLTCALKEALRLYPPFPTLNRLIENDTDIDGTVLPKGSIAAVCPRALHLNVDQEPEVFRPERFLPQNSGSIHSCAYIPFSTGPRNCIAEEFATQGAKVVLANILRNFMVTSVDPVDRIPVSQGVVGRPAVPIALIIKLRSVT